MSKLISIAGLAALLSLSATRAQLAPPNELNVTWSHVHVLVPDRDKEAKSWLTLGGQLGNNLTNDNVAIAFPGVVILIGQTDTKGGSAGSVLDHVAFRVPNLQESVARWKAANWGLREQPGADRAGQALFTTINQVKAEILEDRALKLPIVFDHVHFMVPEGDLSKIEGYYVKLLVLNWSRANPSPTACREENWYFQNRPAPRLQPSAGLWITSVLISRDLMTTLRHSRRRWKRTRSSSVRVIARAPWETRAQLIRLE